MDARPSAGGAGGLARTCCRGILVLGVVVFAACGRNVKTIPPVLQGFSLLGDTLWSVPVPIQGGRERVNRLYEARERRQHSPGEFVAAYDVARYTADLGRYTQAITLYGEAAAMGGFDPRPYARRGELYLLLRKIERGYGDLRTAERLFTGEPVTELQINAGGEMLPRSLSHSIPHLLGIANLVRGEPARAVDYFASSAASVESLRDAIHATLWYRVGRPGPDLPATLPRRFRGGVTAMLANAAREASPPGCPTGTGQMVEPELLCLASAMQLLAQGKRDQALASFDLIRRRSHWSVPAHLVAEATTARLQLEGEAATGDRKSREE